MERRRETMLLGAAVLAGGKSSRMNGVNKAALTVDGETFLSRLLGELAGFEELLVSADREGRYADCPVPVVADRVADAGPMGGLYSLLSVCRSDALLVTPCDTPLFPAALAEHLRSYLSRDWDAFLIEDRTGRLHPLCGIYRKTCVPALRAQLDGGNYRVSALLERLRVKRVCLANTVFPDSAVCNINRPEDYRALVQARMGPALIAVSGVKNSGKTTFLTRLIPRLTERGYRVAVIKHDGHDFLPDVPGTDSFRCREAGAEGTAVFSSRRYLVTRQAPVSMETLTGFFRDADLILAEGFKHSAYPKIELVRSAVSCRSVCDPGTLLAIATDTRVRVPGVPVIGLDDADAAAELIDRYVRRRGSGAVPV